MANKLILVTDPTQVIVNPVVNSLCVEPVNKAIQLLPCTTVISLDAGGTNFAIQGDTTVESTNVAVEAVDACMLIVETGLGFELADANDLGHFNVAAGVALTTVLAGQSATSLIDGKIEDPKWSWTVGDPIFMSAIPGELTQVYDGTALFSRIVAIALTPTLIHVHQYDATLIN